MKEEKKDTATKETAVKSESTPSFKDKVMKNKFLLIVVGLVILILMVAGFVSDQRMDIKDRFLWKGEVAQEDLTAKELEECKEDLKAVADCEDDSMVVEGNEELSDDTNEVKDEMMKVESNFGDYVISFNYPERFVNTGHDFVAVGEGFGDESMTERYELLTEISMGQEEIATRIFMVTDYEFMMSYGDSPEESIDEFGQEEVEINGIKYPVQQFAIGDGYLGRSSMESNYLVKLEDDLYLSVVRMTKYEGTFCKDDTYELDDSLCTKDRCVVMDDCTDFEAKTISETKTPQEDIDDAFKIMESFTWEKAE